MDGTIEMRDLLAELKPCESEVNGKCYFWPPPCFCKTVLRQEKEGRKKTALKALAEQKNGVKR